MRVAGFLFFFYFGNTSHWEGDPLNYAAVWTCLTIFPTHYMQDKDEKVKDKK